MADTGTIGTAYVQILPSTQGIAGAVAAALGGGGNGGAAGAVSDAVTSGVNAGLLGSLTNLPVIGGIAKAILNPITLGTAAVVGMGSAAVKTGMDFDSSMSQVYGLMSSVHDGAGLTAAEMTTLRDRAREMGSTTQFTAAQAAEAMGYMALAGWDVTDIVSGIPSVLGLAQASSMDLGRASDIVTDYMGAFSATGPSAIHLVDLLAYAQSNSNATTEQFAQSWQYSAGMLNAFGQSADTGTAILARLADQGHKASTGGVELNAVLASLYQAMDKNGDITFNDQLIHLDDEDGNFRNLIDIFGDMQAALGGNFDASGVEQGLDQVEKALEGLDPDSAEYAQAYVDAINALSAAGSEGGGLSPGSVGYITALSGLFGNVRGMRGIQAILNGDVNAMKEFETELINSDGTAESVGQTMTDNLAGDLKILNSAFDDLKIAISDGLTPVLRDFVQLITPVVQGLANLLGGKGATPFKGAAEDFEALSQEDWEATGARIEELFGVLNDPNASTESVTAAKEELNGLAAMIANLNWGDTGDNAAQGIASGMTSYSFSGDGMTVGYAIIDAINNAIQAHSPAQALVPTGTNVSAGIGKGMSEYDFTNDSMAILVALQGGMVEAGAAADWSSVASAIATGVAAHMETAKTPILNAVDSVLAAAKRRAQAKAGTFGSVGRQIAQGMAQGIRSGSSSIVDAIEKAIEEGIEAGKKKAETGSPSRLFARELGQWIPKGIAKGILDNAYTMNDALGDSITDMDRYGSALSYNPDFGGNADRNGFTQNITVNSPRALSPWEVARQTRNATRQMALSMRR